MTLTIEQAIQGLNYASQANSDWYLFDTTQIILPSPVTLTCEGMISATHRKPGSYCEKFDFQEWFNKTIQEQQQHQEYVNLMAAYYLNSNLTNLIVFKLMSDSDEYNYSYYAVGEDEKGNIYGAYTYSLEY